MHCPKHYPSEKISVNVLLFIYAGEAMRNAPGKDHVDKRGGPAYQSRRTSALSFLGSRCQGKG